MRLPWLALALALLVALGRAEDFNVKSYGATGDGKTIDSDAINRAITAASAAGGGTVHIPAGTYLSVSIRLRSRVALEFEPGAVIEAADGAVRAYDEPEPNEWGDQGYQDFGHSHWHNSLIWGDGLDTVAITGPGRIYGKGLDRTDHPPAGAGNKAIALKNCRNVTLRDFSILHGGHFGVLATGVDNLTIDNLQIDTNRDGIDLDCCRNVRLTNCNVNAPFDDAICLKSSYGLGCLRATEDVTITNCHVSGYVEGSLLNGTFARNNPAGSPLAHPGGPMGRIKFGTESNGGFKNITISNCTFDHCRGLALEMVDGGELEDVSVTNLAMRDVGSAPLFVRLGNRARGPNAPAVGRIRRVAISNVVASDVDARFGCIFSGIPGHAIEDLRLSHIHIVYRGGGTKADAAREPAEKEDAFPDPGMFGTMPAYGFYVRHVKGLTLDDVDISHGVDDQRPAFILEDVADADLNQVQAECTAGAARLVLKAVTGLQVSHSLGLPDFHHGPTVERQVY